MIHFVYLTLFALFISIAFGVYANGTSRERIIYAAKSFVQFMVVSLVLGWILYFIP